MALPDPIPDDPKRWDGWRSYNSDNLYERLCLTYDERPTNQTIEENCRQLLMWWQKKLPLKNQPSNPVAAMLRAGLDDAPRYLTLARVELIDPSSRARLDAVLASKLKERAHEEFHKFLAFAISKGVLSRAAEEKLIDLGLDRGLTGEEITNLIDHQLHLAGAAREDLDHAGNGGGRFGAGDPESEFLRLLELAGFEGGEMTDDQRDAFVNMAENLGIEPGRAEDMIDEWIEEKEAGMFSQPAAGGATRSTPHTTKVMSPAVSEARAKVQTNSVSAEPKAPPVPELTPDEERAKFPNYLNTVVLPMILIPSGAFLMGSEAAGASPNEAPVHQVSLSRFFMAQYPVTNAIYEMFNPSQEAKRPAGAGSDHPVVHVSSLDAMRFCEWLSKKEGRKYRLPTEAEWEYAARGTDGRIYPWGNDPGSMPLANFADRNTNFAWSDARIDDGWAETSPVGTYPRGASPFSIFDLSGNVWEWCLDYYDNYSKSAKRDPRGRSSGNRRVFRGGSWRSRFSNLRAPARSFNFISYACNDVGFRVVCECA